jgi:hypothetical protein
MLGVTGGVPDGVRVGVTLIVGVGVKFLSAKI